MKEYAVEIDGVEHTLQLDDNDVKKLGDAAKPATKQASAPKNKSA